MTKKPTNQPLAIEFWLQDFIENLKQQTIVRLPDLEKFYKKAINLITAIEEIRNSRAKWRTRAKEAEALLKENEIS